MLCNVAFISRVTQFVASPCLKQKLQKQREREREQLAHNRELIGAEDPEHRCSVIGTVLREGTEKGVLAYTERQGTELWVLALLLPSG